MSPIQWGIGSIGGTDPKEDWEWVEPESEKLELFVTVIQTGESEYSMIIDDHPIQGGLESFDCTGKREAEICAELLTASYGVYGSCTIYDRIPIKDGGI